MLIACVYLIIIAVNMKQYAALAINDGVITPTPAVFGLLGAMEHASVDHCRLQALGSLF